MHITPAYLSTNFHFWVNCPFKSVRLKTIKASRCERTAFPIKPGAEDLKGFRRCGLSSFMCFGFVSFVSFDSFSLFPNNESLKYSVSMLFGGICSVLEEDS